MRPSGTPRALSVNSTFSVSKAQMHNQVSAGDGTSFKDWWEAMELQEVVCGWSSFIEN